MLYSIEATKYPQTGFKNSNIRTLWQLFTILKNSSSSFSCLLHDSKPPWKALIFSHYVRLYKNISNGSGYTTLLVLWESLDWLFEVLDTQAFILKLLTKAKRSDLEILPMMCMFPFLSGGYGSWTAAQAETPDLLVSSVVGDLAGGCGGVTSFPAPVPEKAVADQHINIIVI